MLKGSVIGPFGFRREKAGREFPAVQVIAQAIATGPLFGARFIAAITGFFVFLYTVHKDSRFEIRNYW
jgi:hypothetical protein